MDGIEKIISSEDIFDNYRSMHLAPLMRTTMQLQRWMEDSQKGYYIALRLKRKNQILRKLKRFHVRLSQLQDIAGARIILDKNSDVDEVVNYILRLINSQSDIKLLKDIDYRAKGRDDSGYRARHMILECDNIKIELQLRSRIQHYWAETIERTSVVYGYYLKELEGDIRVLDYFKKLSNFFYEIEIGRKPSIQQHFELQVSYKQALQVIKTSKRYNVLESHADHDVLKAIYESSAKGSKGNYLNNWILIFNWTTGNFITWEKAPKDPIDAGAFYAKCEKKYPAGENYEVVLVGASDVETIEQTHSHYFGIESYDGVLKNLDASIEAIQLKQKISIEERKILFVLRRRHCWNDKTIALSTLKNHHCQGIIDFENAIERLLKIGLINRNSPTSPISLNVAQKHAIDELLN